jgi:phage-related protein
MAVSEELLIKVKVNSGDSSKSLSQLQKELKELGSADEEILKAALALESMNAETIRINQEVGKLDKEVVSAGASLGKFFQTVNDMTLEMQHNVEATNILTAAFKTIGTIGFGEKFGKGLIGTTLAADVAATVLTVLGKSAENAESNLLGILAGASLVAGFLLGQFSSAVLHAINLLSDLAISIGVTLYNSMRKFETVFTKLDKTIHQFQFGVKNFADSTDGASGSLENWEKVVENLTETTAFSLADISKAVKILVAEGSAIGLEYSQQFELLTRATDIASFHSRDLTDTLLALVSGLTGNSSAVIALGIDLRELALTQNLMSEASDKSLDNMSDLQKTQLRYNQIMKKTSPIIGSAAEELRTFDGRVAQVNKTVELIQSKIGQMGVLYRFIIDIVQKTTLAILKLPDPILKMVGTFTDFGSVILIVGGYLLKYLSAITLLIGGFDILNKVIKFTSANSKSLGGEFLRQEGIKSLSDLLSVFGKGFKTSIADVLSRFANLDKISKGLKATLISLAAGLLGFFQQVVTFGGKAIVILAPIAAKLTLLFLLVTATSKAMGEIVGEVSIVSDAISDFSKSLDNVSEGLGHAAEVSKDFGKSLKSNILPFVNLVLDKIAKIVKVLILGFGTAASVLSYFGSVILKVGFFLTESTPSLDKFIRKSEFAMASLSKSVKDVIDSFLEYDKKIIESEKLGASFFSKTQKKLSLGEVELDVLNFNKIEIFGDEFEKAIGKAQKSLTEFNREKDKFDRANAESSQEAIDLLKKVKDSREESYKLFFSGQKQLIDLEKNWREELSKTEVELLKASGEERKALQLSIELNKKKFDLEVKNLKHAENVFFGGQTRITALSKKFRENLELELKLFDLRKKQEALKKIDDERIKVLDDLKSRYKSLSQSIIDLEKEASSQGKSTSENLQYGYQLQLESLEVEREKLRVAGLLDKKIGEEIDKLKSLHGKEFELKIKAAESSKNFFTSEGLQDIQNVLGVSTKNFASVLGKGVGALNGAVGAVGGLLAVIFKLPEILKSVSGILNQITDWPKALIEASEEVLSSFTNLVRNFLGNVIDQVGNSIDAAVDFQERLPEALSEGLKKFIDALVKLFDKLPEMVQRVAKNAITFLPKLTLSIVKGAVKLVSMLVKTLPKLIPEIIVSVVDGTIEAIKELLNELFKIFGGKAIFNLGKGIEEGANKAVKTLTGVSEQLFTVRDATKEAQGLDIADKIAKAITSSGNRAAAFLIRAWKLIEGFLVKTWHFLLDLLSKAWLGIIEGLTFLFDGVVQAFKWVFEDVLSPIFNGILEGLKGAWEILKSVGEGLVIALGALWEALKTIGQGLADLLGEAWKGLEQVGVLVSGLFSKAFEALLTVVNKGAEVLTAALNLIFEGLKKTWESLGTIWNTLKDIGRPILDGLKSLFDGLSGIFDTATKPLRDLFSGLKNLFVESIKPLTDLFGGLKETFSGAIAPVRDIFQGSARFFENIFKGLKGILNLDFTEAGKGFSEALTSGLKDSANLFIKIANGFIETINKLKIPALDFDFSILGKRVSGRIWGDIDLIPGDIEKFAEFNSGGLVPGSGSTDSVPSLLTPGEFVINKNSANSLGSGVLASLNKGIMPQSNVNQNFEVRVEINTTQPLDADVIRTKIVPQMMGEIKKQSLRGHFVLSDKGTRS